MRRLRIGGIVVGAVVLAWLIRWGCDDAFISYVYARNLVRGDGLTWFGDHVEGYTNFGWVLWIAGGLKLGVAPLVWAWLGSLGSLAISLLSTYRVAKLRTANEVTALCTLALLATNFTFLAFGTSGLETMAQCALLATAFAEVEHLRRTTDRIRVCRLVGLSTIAALALWIRLDSAVYLAVLAGVLAVHLVRIRTPARVWLAALAPAGVLVGGWLAWKLAYYDDLLPNTFHAKVAVSSQSLRSAGAFTVTFVSEYVLWVPIALVVAMVIATRAFTARLPLVLVAAWTTYVIGTGGDFMEFRFFVPILPPLFLVIAETLTAGGPPHRLKPALRALVLVAIMTAFSVRHAARYDGRRDGSNDSIGRLATFYGAVRDDGWSQLGTSLGVTLAGTGAILATHGAGAIPYHADLPTIDQLGLNDRWVARHGLRPAAGYARPGHQRFAPEQYLAERNVNFVIGTPVVIPRGTLTQLGLTRDILIWMEQLIGPTPVAVDPIVVVAAPISTERAILLWYRQPTPLISDRIRAVGWEMRTVRRLVP